MIIPFFVGSMKLFLTILLLLHVDVGSPFNRVYIFDLEKPLLQIVVERAHVTK